MPKLLSLLLLPACVLAQSVEGTVYDAATGRGAVGVKVELLRQTTPFYETTTDAGGHFRFDNLRETDYAVRYQSPDYFSTAGPSDYKPFKVAAGDPVKLEARLLPWSHISGRVVDARGNPVPNALLELTGSGMVANGRTYLRTSWGGGGGGELGHELGGMGMRGASDAQGKFDVQLMPGAYGLSVTPPPMLKPPEDHLAWVRTWYPGVPRADAATKIVVQPGGEVQDVELKLLAVPAHAVRGIVLAPNGDPAPNVPVTLVAEMRKEVKSNADGIFEFPAVPEGEWRITADRASGGVPDQAAEWVEVTAHDVENVKLRLAAPLTARGRVIVDAPKDKPAPRLASFILAPRGRRDREVVDVGPGPGAALVQLDANGNLTIEGLYPGLYHLSPMMQPPLPPYYLDAILIGGANLIIEDVEFPAADNTLTVVYKTDGGSVTGKAENCASGGVVLVPRDPVLRRQYTRSGACLANDYYEIRSVRPGDYYALAMAGNGPVVPLDEALLNQAAKVTIRAGEATSADVRTVTRPVF